MGHGHLSTTICLKRKSKTELIKLIYDYKETQEKLDELLLYSNCQVNFKDKDYILTLKLFDETSKTYEFKSNRLCQVTNEAHLFAKLNKILDR